MEFVGPGKSDRQLVKKQRARAQHIRVPDLGVDSWNSCALEKREMALPTTATYNSYWTGLEQDQNSRWALGGLYLYGLLHLTNPTPETKPKAFRVSGLNVILEGKRKGGKLKVKAKGERRYEIEERHTT